MPDAIASAYCLLTMSVLFVGAVVIVPDVSVAVVIFAEVAVIAPNDVCAITPAASCYAAFEDG